MKTKLSAALAAAWGAFACIAVLGAPSSARADTAYAINYEFLDHLGNTNEVRGSIITDDGVVGALVPSDILSWDLTTTSERFCGAFVCVNITHAGSDTGMDAGGTHCEARGRPCVRFRAGLHVCAVVWGCRV